MTDEPYFDTAEDATKLKWRYHDHRDGESARFAVCGLFAYVQDCDGDYSTWEIRKGRPGPVIVEGSTFDFFVALHDAEMALRGIVIDRIAALRADTPARPDPPSPIPHSRRRGSGCADRPCRTGRDRVRRPRPACLLGVLTPATPSPL